VVWERAGGFGSMNAEHEISRFQPWLGVTDHGGHAGHFDVPIFGVESGDTLGAAPSWPVPADEPTFATWKSGQPNGGEKGGDIAPASDQHEQSGDAQQDFEIGTVYR